MTGNFWLRVEMAHHIRAVRSTAESLAYRAELTEERSHELTVAAGELASNLVAHGGGGEIILQPTLERPGVEIIALDRGPGMVDVEKCLQPGFSTTGSLGAGMKIVKDLASDFDLHSERGKGTVIVARFWARDAPPHPKTPVLGFVAPPMPTGEVIEANLTPSGSGWRLTVASGADGTDAEVEVDGSIGLCRVAPQVHVGVWDLTKRCRVEPELDSARGLPTFRWDWNYLLVVASRPEVLHALERRPELLERHPAVIGGVLYRDLGAEEVGLAVLARGDAAGAREQVA